MGFLRELTTGQKIGIGLGSLFIFGLAFFFYGFSTQNKQAVLFSGMTGEEAAAVIQELDAHKYTYSLAENGESILVDASDLDQIKAKLSGKKLAVGGGSKGFELFDDAEYGMTEFSQKINYQRAIQGELARTISNLEEIKFARVHIVVPETKLFAKENEHPKASVTLILNKGFVLSPFQVLGIQELVASSVDKLEPEQVIVLDQSGVRISTSDVAVEDDNKGNLFESKLQYENHLTKKLQRILDQLVGSGLGLVSVSVELEEQNLKQTKEMPIGASNSESGILVKSSKTTSSNSSGGSKDNPSPSGKTESKAEQEYGVGKLIEQRVEQGIEIKRLMVSIVVPLEQESNLANIESLISSSAGIEQSRGDSVVVKALPIEALETKTFISELSTEKQYVNAGISVLAPKQQGSDSQSKDDSFYIYVVVIAALILLLLSVLIISQWKSRLSNEERQLLLVEVREWLEKSDATTLDSRSS